MRDESHELVRARTHTYRWNSLFLTTKTSVCKESTPRYHLQHKIRRRETRAGVTGVSGAGRGEGTPRARTRVLSRVARAARCVTATRRYYSYNTSPWHSAAGKILGKQGGGTRCYHKNHHGTREKPESDISPIVTFIFNNGEQPKRKERQKTKPSADLAQHLYLKQKTQSAVTSNKPWGFLKPASCRSRKRNCPSPTLQLLQEMMNTIGNIFIY